MKIVYTMNRVKVKGGCDYFLMSLDTKTNEIKVGAYTNSGFEMAIEKYNELEQRPHTNNVLASAKSMAELRAAYPNYFGDVKNFLTVLNEYLV